MAKVTSFITSIVQKPACVFNGSRYYSGILIITWFQGLLPAKAQGSHGNWIWPFHSYWKLQSLNFSFCKMCCWPTSVSSWTNELSFEEWWPFTRRGKKNITKANLFYIKVLMMLLSWFASGTGRMGFTLVSASARKKKQKNSGNVSKAPTRPHILETLSCKEPQPPTYNYYTCKHKTKAFPSLLWLSCIIRDKNERQHLLFIKMIEMMNKFP